MKCLVEDKPWFSEIVLPVGTYTEQTEAVRTVALKVCLLVDAYASEEAVYYLTSVILEHSDEIKDAHTKGKELKLEAAANGTSVPYHKGAAKYFEEQSIYVET